MTDELNRLLVLLDNEAIKAIRGEPSDTALLANMLERDEILLLISKLNDEHQQKAALLSLQSLLENLTELCSIEKKQVSNELEKLQLAKKGSARYHDIQEP